MPFNPKERSELEKRFDQLFQTALQCRVTDILDPQYEVNYKGQTFYIDYVYQTDTEKISIELMAEVSSMIRNTIITL